MLKKSKSWTLGKQHMYINVTKFYKIIELWADIYTLYKFINDQLV